MNTKKLVLADSVKDRLGQALWLRAPWLVMGLVWGLFTSVVVSRYRNTLEENIAVAFFLPVIVYMSDAVGTQTEAVFVRRLAFGKVHFGIYLMKEAMVGGVLGVVLGLVVAGAAWIWIRDFNIAATVGIAMLVNVILAPIMAMVIPEIMFKEHVDPAIGSGPFTTIIQDLASVMVYLVIAGIILG